MSSPIIDIQSITTEAGLSNFKFDAPENKRVGNSPLLDNGLNLLYSLRGYGKTYTSIQIAKESGLPTVFIDLESNGKAFVEYCKANNVAYVYAGGCEDIYNEIQKLVLAIKKQHSKVLIIIDSYSDIFPNDESQMATQTQKNLGALHNFFMREVECPVLLLDHATEITSDTKTKKKSFKIEGNKSGKFKKTVVVLRLEQIGNDIKNGTFVTVERSRNQDELSVGHRQQYKRGNYLTDKIQSLIDKGRLSKEFTATDLKACLSGDDRKLWIKERDTLAKLVKTENKKTYWSLITKGDNS